jgi:hypothetical protein
LTEAFPLIRYGNIFINRNKKEEEIMKNSKLSTFIGLTLALLLAFSLVTGCATNQAGKTTEAELTDSTVRVPPGDGDPSPFWEEFGWADMTKAEQALWGVLGWTEESWEEEAKPPASEDQYWNQLSDEERDACEKLGYTKKLWDES